MRMDTVILVKRQILHVIISHVDDKRVGNQSSESLRMEPFEAGIGKRTKVRCYQPGPSKGLASASTSRGILAAALSDS